jgi:hypothetical protein
MVGSVGARAAQPVVNPNLREGKRRRLMRIAVEEMARLKGPQRQTLYPRLSHFCRVPG